MRKQTQTKQASEKYNSFLLNYIIRRIGLGPKKTMLVVDCDKYRCYYSRVTISNTTDITHMENTMRGLLSKLKECDGAFCESVSLYAFMGVTFAIMYLSISSING